MKPLSAGQRKAAPKPRPVPMIRPRMSEAELINRSAALSSKNVAGQRKAARPSQGIGKAGTSGPRQNTGQRKALKGATAKGVSRRGVGLSISMGVGRKPISRKPATPSRVMARPKTVGNSKDTYMPQSRLRGSKNKVINRRGAPNKAGPVFGAVGRSLGAAARGVSGFPGQLGRELSSLPKFAGPDLSNLPVDPGALVRTVGKSMQKTLKDHSR